MKEYDAKNRLDAEQVAAIRARAKSHGPGLMSIYMSDIMALCDTVDTLRARITDMEEAARLVVEQWRTDTYNLDMLDIRMDSLEKLLLILEG